MHRGRGPAHPRQVTRPQPQTGPVRAGAALLAWLPRTGDLHGGSVTNELAALRRLDVWLMGAVAALGISSIFAVYTFIGPFVTDAARQDPALIPVALAVFGPGMAAGNHLGGRVADRHEHLGLIWGYGGVLALLVLIGVAGGQPAILLPSSGPASPSPPPGCCSISRPSSGRPAGPA